MLRGALMRSADAVPGLSPRAAAGHGGETGLKTRSSPGLPLPGLLARKSTLFFLFSLFFSSLPLSFLPSFLIFILHLDKGLSPTKNSDLCRSRNAVPLLDGASRQDPPPLPQRYTPADGQTSSPKHLHSFEENCSTQKSLTASLLELSLARCLSLSLS